MTEVGQPMTRWAARPRSGTLQRRSREAIAADSARRRHEFRLRELELRANRKEGEGKAELLLRQLTKRVGPLPRAVLAQVEAATSEELDAWAERVLTEPPLDVLAP